jgi:hypothetical protein
MPKTGPSYREPVDLCAERNGENAGVERGAFTSTGASARGGFTGAALASLGVARSAVTFSARVRRSRFAMDA